MLIKIDGKEYNVINSELTRNFQVLDGENAGRTLDGEMHRDVIGTYYNYTWKLEPKNIEDYSELYDVLSSPDDYHTITIPYNQSTKTFKAYVTNGQDQLRRQEDGVNYWTGLSVNFIAISPNRIKEWENEA